MATNLPLPTRSDGETEGAVPSPLPEGVSVTLWLNELTAAAGGSRLARIQDRVAALDDAGVETTVREWPARATDPGDERDRAAIDAFDHYRAVAGQQDVRLDPFFRCRTTDDRGRAVVFPAACLVLERGAELTGLYPCRIDGEPVTVEDGLDAIGTGTAENLR
ncbi:HTH domain-containing protein [Haloglomus litoreum]|uniref:HTH domain-containing protein n=1 Tax=Haloglomus litoreum TaxID=3034026 RepID=UPI0023E7BF85|nr:HTH domain-containing protein [Haloglomus sp. DT116]